MANPKAVETPEESFEKRGRLNAWICSRFQNFCVDLGLTTQLEGGAGGPVLKAHLNNKHIVFMSNFISCHFGGEIVVEVVGGRSPLKPPRNNDIILLSF